MDISPKPKEEIKMLSFTDAMYQISIGKKVHKLEWKDKEFYGFMQSDMLSIHKADGKTHQWILSTGDIQGDDYIVI